MRHKDVDQAVEWINAQPKSKCKLTPIGLYRCWDGNAGTWHDLCSHSVVGWAEELGWKPEEQDVE